MMKIEVTNCKINFMALELFGIILTTRKSLESAKGNINIVTTLDKGDLNKIRGDKQ